MVIYNDAEKLFSLIDRYFKIKPSSIGDSYIYLGGKLNKMRIKNRVWSGGNSPAIYFKESVANVENYLVDLDGACWQLSKNKTENPFLGYYAPEMDETPALEQELASWYQYFIGMLSCMT